MLCSKCKNVVILQFKTKPHIQLKKISRYLFVLLAFSPVFESKGQIATTIPGNTCWATPTAFGSNYADYTNYRPLDFHVDGYSNSYVAAYKYIGTDFNGLSRYEYNITKFDSTGAVVWNKNQNAVVNYVPTDYFRTAFVTGITSDANENTYVTGFFASEKIIFDSIVFNYGSSANRGFIARLDSNGVFRWVAILDGGGNYCSGTSIACSGNKLYVGVSAAGGMNIHTPDGNTNALGKMAVVEMDVFGSFITDYSYTNGLNDSRPIVFDPTTASTQLCHYIPTSPVIEIAPSGKIFVVGRTSNYITVGQTNYVGPYPTYCNTYCLVLDTATGFQPPFYMSYRSHFFDSYELQRIEKKPVFAVDASDNIYYVDHWEDIFTQLEGYETVFLPNSTVLAGTDPASSCILKYNSAGQLLWNSIHSDITWSSVVSNSAGVYFYGSYRDSLLIRSRNGDSLLYQTNNGYQNVFVAKADTAGNFQYVSPFGGNDKDIAYFIRKSPCSDNFYIAGLQSYFLITFNQQQVIQATQAHRMFVLKHSPSASCYDPVCVIPSGIEDPAQTPHQELSLFPIPAKELINVADLPQGSYTIRITDVKGQLLSEESRFISGTHPVKLPVLEDGIYLLSFVSQTHFYAGRFIIVNEK